MCEFELNKIFFTPCLVPFRLNQARHYSVLLFGIRTHLLRCHDVSTKLQVLAMHILLHKCSNYDRVIVQHVLLYSENKQITPISGQSEFICLFASALCLPT